ncbi:MAG: hypothetical protein AOA65_0383 [Candidatus Bathyarchaeota archaeon BA1]|nr:MAG: hypothetical protein AOA65_0383 [Candidatus Bathyarchaeota archaeon BA1]
MFLKLFRVIPWSPEYELVNVVFTIIGVALMIITGFQEWLRSRFGNLEDTIERLTNTIQNLDKRFTILETKLESVQLIERVPRLEEKLEKRKEKPWVNGFLIENLFRH